MTITSGDTLYFLLTQQKDKYIRSHLDNYICFYSQVHFLHFNRPNFITALRKKCPLQFFCPGLKKQLSLVEDSDLQYVQEVVTHFI